jgi:hypothetical protein
MIAMRLREFELHPVFVIIGKMTTSEYAVLCVR